MSVLTYTFFLCFELNNKFLHVIYIQYGLILSVEQEAIMGNVN